MNLTNRRNGSLPWGAYPPLAYILDKENIIKNITKEVEELVRLYLEEAPEEYIQACLYGYRESTINANIYAIYNKKYLPEKGNRTASVFILNSIDLKFCPQCKIVYDKSNFRKNSAKPDGVQNQCKICHQKNTTKTQRGRESKRRAAKLQRTPKWVGEDEHLVMSIFINNCPSDKHTDHIIPLQGKLVCGLHVPENLQYLLISDNCSKSNSFDIIKFNNL